MDLKLHRNTLRRSITSYQTLAEHLPHHPSAQGVGRTDEDSQSHRSHQSSLYVPNHSTNAWFCTGSKEYLHANIITQHCVIMQGREVVVSIQSVDLEE
jgi:hypothetical protein